MIRVMEIHLRRTVVITLVALLFPAPPPPSPLAPVRACRRVEQQGAAP